MKRLTIACLALCVALGMACAPLSALADSLPIIHRDSKDSPPYESVPRAAQAPFSPDADIMQVDVVGIRQGDCIVIRCGGQTMLIDGGEGWRLYMVERYLEAMGIDGFDVMFLTHAHDDHVEMQEKLINAGYRVGKVISPYTAQDNYALWNGYRKLLQKKDIPFETVKDGDVIAFGGATLTIYRNTSKGITMNNHSAAAMLRFGDASMFLSADIGGETQHYFLKEHGAEAFSCDIYKSAHHGRTATVAEFLTAMDPALAVVTNTRSSTETNERQLKNRDIARYYISMGTVCLQTDGTQWFAWQEVFE